MGTNDDDDDDDDDFDDDDDDDEDEIDQLLRRQSQREFDYQNLSKLAVTLIQTAQVLLKISLDYS